MSDRLRKFFRIRGKTGFVLDEVVAPVVLVQDLTEGPYQSGVTPAAGVIAFQTGATGTGSLAILLNDKPGSITPVLDRQFDNRSFSVSWIEIQLRDVLAAIEPLDDLRFSIGTRASVVAAGVPTSAESLVAIQINDGSQLIPVELVFIAAGIAQGSLIWRGVLGDNTNTLGSRRTMEPEPNITIGPNDALIFTNATTTIAAQDLFVTVRGFYQEQPA